MRFHLETETHLQACSVDNSFSFLSTWAFTDFAQDPNPSLPPTHQVLDAKCLKSEL
jgi:hypothetical protein